MDSTRGSRQDRNGPPGRTGKRLWRLRNPRDEGNPEAAAVRRNIEQMKEARAEGLDVAEIKLMAGTQYDRLIGLEPLSMICPGRSVLDVGCHRGLISNEAARFGAALVHGIDLYPQGIATAREIFRDSGIPHQFAEFDLSLGRDAIVEALGNMLLPSYDILLMLAVLQHLRRQMPAAAVDDLLDFFIERTGSYLVLRLPNVDSVDQRIAKHGLKRAYFNHLNKKLAPIVIYERN